MVDKSKVYQCVVEFMEENEIKCDETIWQCDRILENSLPFITKLFEIVKEDLDLEDVDDEI